MLRAALLAIALAGYWLAAGPAARAAEIEVERDDDGFAVVTVVGTLVPGDDRAFRQAVSGVSEGIVLFHSGGGALRAGIGIGRIIRMRGMMTAVPPEAICASACALAWLGGRVRLKSLTGLVGFHAASERDGGVARESGAANALVGSYLSDLGLTERAILFATTPPPDAMAWLTADRARAVGIPFGVFEEAFGDASEDVPEDVPAKAPAPPPDADAPETVATRFVEAHLAAARRGSEAWLGWAARAYAPTVRYHGERRTRRAVLDELSRFAERWPQRFYGLRERPTTACEPGGVCSVEGVGVYQAASRERRALSNGVFTFAYRVDVSGPAPRILAEESLVIDRLIAEMPAGGAFLVTLIQLNLARLGCEQGTIDGVWGGRTAAAIRRFNRETGRALSARAPERDTLRTLERGPIGACVPERPRPGRSIARLPGRDLPGGDYRVVRQVPLGTCESSCLADKRCAAFTFDRRNEWCFLKKRVPEPVDFREATSGIVREGTITVEPLRRP